MAKTNYCLLYRVLWLSWVFKSHGLHDYVLSQP